MKKLPVLFVIIILFISCGTQTIAKDDFQNSIQEKYWKLKTVDGNSVSMAENQEREIYFILKNDKNVKGFAGCNTLMGGYQLENKNKLKFVNIGTTRKACAGIDDHLLINVLNNTNSYALAKDILQLKRAGEVLATFEAVYF